MVPKPDESDAQSDAVCRISPDVLRAFAHWVQRVKTQRLQPPGDQQDLIGGSDPLVGKERAP
ncbi:MAG: hypothetical protein C3F12_04375 [Candidatus Methylomirabilota bacterium]|nr:MAG: hypothetical protein C3F12_04375 [candidate division NC10 bacterium]